MPAQKRLFLSHASADKPLADLLRNTLVLGGVADDRIFYSSNRGTGIPSGEEVSTYLRRSLQQAGLVIELLSETFLSRPICLMELGGAWALQTPTYPLVVPPLTREEATRQIGNVQMGVLGTTQEIDDIFNELHDRLARDLGIQCNLTAWSRAIAEFKQQARSRLVTAQAAAAAIARPDNQARQERPGPGPPEAAQPEILIPARVIDLNIASRLREEMRDLDEHQRRSPEDVADSSSIDPYDRPIRTVDRLVRILTEILDSVDDDPRLMEQLLEDTHQLVTVIRSVVKQRIFRLSGRWGPSSHIHDEFDRVRDEENDRYELYANDLERYQRRQIQDLNVVLERRRTYISTLQVFQANVRAILDHPEHLPRPG